MQDRGSEKQTVEMQQALRDDIDLCLYALKMIDRISRWAIEDSRGEVPSLRDFRADEASVDFEKNDYLHELKSKLIEELMRNNSADLEDAILAIRSKFRHKVYLKMIEHEVKLKQNDHALQQLKHKEKLNYFILKIIAIDIGRDLIHTEKMIYFSQLLEIQKKKLNPNPVEAWERNSFSGTSARQDACEIKYCQDESSMSSNALSKNLIMNFEPQQLDMENILLDIESFFIEEIEKNNGNMLHRHSSYEERVRVPTQTLVDEHLLQLWNEALDGKNDAPGFIKKSMERLDHAKAWITQGDKPAENKYSDLMALTLHADRCLKKSEQMTSTPGSSVSAKDKSSNRQSFDWKTPAFIAGGVLLGLAIIGLCFMTGGFGFLLIHMVHSAVIVFKLATVGAAMAVGGGLGYGSKKIVDCVSCQIELEECGKSKSKGCLSQLPVICQDTAENSVNHHQASIHFPKKKASVAQQGAFKKQDEIEGTSNCAPHHFSWFKGIC